MSSYVKEFYKITDKLGSVVVSHSEITCLTTDPSMSNEDKEKAIQKYLDSHNAIRVSSVDMDEYQKATKATAIYPKETALPYLTLGLASEAGEVAGKYKKVIRDTKEITPEWTEMIKSEIGDVLWYCARLSDELGLSLSEIAQANISKLTDRKDRGVLGGSGDNR